MGLLTLFFLLSIGFSFLCSIMEAVLLSITPAYARAKVEKGGKVGKLLESYKRDIDRPLSAILTLNTIAHTAGAIGVGVQAGKVFGHNYFNLFGLHISYETLIAGIMTLAILVLSEIIPKTIGANNWRTLVPVTVNSLRILVLILTPFVWMSQLLTRRLKKEKGKSVLRRSDFAVLARAGQESGTLAEKESMFIRNMLQLEQLTVRGIMTPRTVMVVANENLTVKEFYETSQPLRYSRIPIYDTRTDNITGLVLKDDILEALAEDKDDLPLRELKRKILAVQDEQNVYLVFEQLTSQRSHLAVVMDSYGSLAGLVTLEDIIETLFGLEIMDETDSEANLQIVARKLWKKRSKNLEIEDENE